MALIIAAGMFANIRVRRLKQRQIRPHSSTYSKRVVVVTKNIQCAVHSVTASTLITQFYLTFSDFSLGRDNRQRGEALHEMSGISIGKTMSLAAIFAYKPYILTRSSGVLVQYERVF